MVIYNIGDLVFEEFPTVWVISPSFIRVRCNYCLEEGKYPLYKCGNCGFLWYCGKDCQRHDWKDGHRYECAYYKASMQMGKEFFFTYDSLRIVFRLYLLQKNEPERLSKPCKAFNGEMMNYDRLMDHAESIKLRPKTFHTFSHMYWRLCYILQFTRAKLPPIKKDLLYEAFCKIDINEITMTYQGKVYAEGLYMAFARFDHDCSCNCLPIFKKRKIEVRCCRSFDSEKEEASISYMGFDQPRNIRKAMLLEKYFFSCHCKRCEEKDEMKNFLFYLLQTSFYVAANSTHNFEPLKLDLSPYFALQDFFAYSFP